MKVNLSNKQSGFTIIELLISTTILSTILLLTTAAMLGVSRLYTKGISTTRVQNSTRSINEEITELLENSSSGVQPATSPDGNTQALCIGQTRYTYVLGKKVSDNPVGVDQSMHVLWRDKITPGNCAPPNNFLSVANPTPSDSGTELIPPNSRLTVFSISGSSPYAVQIGIAMGDYDQFADGPPAGAVLGKNTRCETDSAGSKFCATSYLETSVSKRLN